jgi:hypothetical protein
MESKLPKQVRSRLSIVLPAMVDEDERDGPMGKKTVRAAERVRFSTQVSGCAQTQHAGLGLAAKWVYPTIGGCFPDQRLKVRRGGRTKGKGRSDCIWKPAASRW